MAIEDGPSVTGVAGLVFPSYLRASPARMR